MARSELASLFTRTAQGVDGTPLRPAQLFVHVHVLTLLGGRAPTPQALRELLDTYAK